MRKLTQSEFIALAKQAHGKKYVYARTEYTGAHDKVIITCRLHGDFAQSAWRHLKGMGCEKCARENKRSTTNAFIKAARAVHGKTYGYEKTKYIRSKMTVVITCKKHGDFEQLPNNHLSGKGCAQCSKTAMKTVKEFIKQAKAVHGNRYSYTESTYVGSREQIAIICKKHGKFLQMSDHHLQGTGCPGCTPKTHSKVAIEWIEREAKARRMKNVWHAENGGEYIIPGTRFRADGFHQPTNTIFEFYGDAYHGNPRRYAHDSTPHPFNKTVTARHLYKRTMERKYRLQRLGYRVISIWEMDYRAACR